MQDIERSFTIAFTVRSGSNAICDLLQRNGLGVPSEWFQSTPELRNGESRLDAFTRLVQSRQAGGIFGAKMAHHHRAALDEWLRGAVAGYRLLDDLLPNHRWVQLIRRDKVLQAVSLCRAESSGVWAVKCAEGKKDAGLTYDFFHLLSRLMMLQGGELAWSLYFEQNHIEPFVIVYEDFFRDVEHQLPQLIDYLGGLPNSRMLLDFGQDFQIQRDTASDALRDRFAADLVRIGESSLIDEIGPPWNRWISFFEEHQWKSPDDTTV